jgi:tetratricopeptide (TPR) repeat protein
MPTIRNRRTATNRPLRYARYLRCSTDDQTHGDFTTIDNQGTPGAPEVELGYTYDAAGNVTSVRDRIAGTAAGITDYVFDQLHRMTRIVQQGAGVSAKRVDFEYNPIGQKTSVSRYRDVAGEDLVTRTVLEFDPRHLLTGLSHRKQDETVVASYAYEYDDAERLLLRADRLAPDDPEILEHLGALYAKKADRLHAVEAYKRALLHRPDERVRRVVEEQLLLLETGRVGSR